MTAANSASWVLERIERPIASASSWIAAVDDLLRGLVEPGVDDLHTGVAQRPRDHVLAPPGHRGRRAPAWLYDHADRTGCHTHHCLHGTDFIDRPAPHRQGK